MQTTNYAYPPVPVAAVVDPPTATLATQNAASSGRMLLARALSSGHQCGQKVKAAPTDALALFTRYDELTQLINSLATASTSKITVERQITDLDRRLTETTQQLAKNRQAQQYTSRRLHRNANPHFFHYLQIDREGKVRQLQQDLDNLRAQERTLESAKADLDAQRKDLVAQLDRYRDQEGTVRRARSEQQQIFDRVVSTIPQSERLQLLLGELTRVQADATVDGQLLSQIESTMARINEARQLFETAHRELQRANRDNRRAEYEAEADMFTLFQEADYYEVSLQRDRDRNINMARQNAHHAGRVLQAAFDSFPMEARVRFPEITRNVCNAAIPNLEGANFGQAMTDDWIFGAYGAMSNDLMAEGKINRNMNILQHCEQLAAFQAASVQSVLQAIRTQKVSLDSKVNTLRSDVLAEKTNMFEQAYRSIMPSSVATAVPVEVKSKRC